MSKNTLFPELKPKSVSVHADFLSPKGKTKQDQASQLTKSSVAASSRLFHPKTSIFYEKRVRSFAVKLSTRLHIFFGLSYVQYDVFMRKDSQIQQVIIRDILNMLLDKASTLKNLLNNTSRIKKIMEQQRKSRQAELNVRLEGVIGLLDYISRLILLDFRDSYKELGIPIAPIEADSRLFQPIKSEMRAFEGDARVFSETVEFFRDCLDCFYIQLRQNKRRKLFEDETMINLIKGITEARFSIGKLYEEYLMYEHIIEEKEKDKIEEILFAIKSKKREESERIRLAGRMTKEDSPGMKRSSIELAMDANNPVIPSTSNLNTQTLSVPRESVASLNNEIPQMVNSGISLQGKKTKKPEIDLAQENEQKMAEKLERVQKLQVLTVLLQKKFRFQGHKFLTRESKIPLNTMREDLSKQVLLEPEKIRKEKVVADNRKKILLDRLSNPFSFMGGAENRHLLQDFSDFSQFYSKN